MPLSIWTAAKAISTFRVCNHTGHASSNKFNASVVKSALYRGGQTRRAKSGKVADSSPADAEIPKTMNGLDGGYVVRRKWGSDGKTPARCI